MKKLIATLVVFTLFSAACGKMSVTLPDGKVIVVNMNPIESNAIADVQACPLGMTLVPPTVGVGAYCMDNAPTTTAIQWGLASSDCLNQGKDLCSMSQYRVACNAGALAPSTHFWAVNIASSANSRYADSANCNSAPAAGTTNLKQYYCCSR